MSVTKLKYAALMAAVAFCPASDVSANTIATLQQCVANTAQRSDFSGVISIMRPDGTITHAQGAMAGPNSPPITPDARFNIGSAGKMWTAVAVAQLVDAGRINLDDTIGRYVTGLTPGASAVTIRQLLTHSGGLGSFFSPDNLDAMQSARSLADLKPLVVGETPIFAPGSRTQYSNTGFLLLGLMIEQVSGQSYGAYLQQHVFAPAGMTSSSMMPAASEIRAVGMTNLPELPRDASGRLALPPGPPPGPPPPGALRGPGAGPDGPPNGMMRPPPGPLRVAAEAALMGTSAGGGYSTAEDMQRFFAALLGGRLTSPAMLTALTTQQVTMVPAREGMPAAHYGFGFGVGSYQGHAWAGHNGGAPGVNIATMAFSDDQITAVIMTNRDPSGADAMMRSLLPILLADGACVVGATTG